MLKSQDKFKEVKIILLTARGREPDLEKGKAVGADSYITKPFSTRDLLQSINDLLNASS